MGGNPASMDAIPRLQNSYETTLGNCLPPVEQVHRPGLVPWHPSHGRVIKIGVAHLLSGWIPAPYATLIHDSAAPAGWGEMRSNN